MAYKVIKAFTDGQDDRYVYQVGDDYPRRGYTPTEDRISGLLGTGNKQGVPLIETVAPAEENATEEVTTETPRKHRRKKG